MSKTMTVRVTGGVSPLWYASKIGREYVVNVKGFEDCVHRDYGIGHGVEDMAGSVIFASHFEVVQVKPRLFNHEGVDYELPKWAKYVTCDGKGKTPFAWECKPKHTDDLGYWHDTVEGEVERLKPYVKLPEGAFIAEV